MLKVTVLATCTNDSVVTNSTQALQVGEARQVAIGACNKVKEGEMVSNTSTMLCCLLTTELGCT